LLKIILAGMTAGNDSLTEGANPKPGKAITLDIDWSLMSDEALEFVKGYRFKLFKGIDQTTAELVQKAVEECVKTGGSLDDLTRTIEPIFLDRSRAESISQTESTRLFYTGSEKRWTDAGVKKAKIRTTQDSHVCNICRPLNGVVANLETGWKVAGGGYSKPPFHVRCRCWAVPVLD
jgi:SPP1 gp7 family putative phage head morphogenesis protein